MRADDSVWRRRFEPFRANGSRRRDRPDLFPAVSQASAVLNFEGVGNYAAVDSYYDGGTDSLGNTGTNYGIPFSSSSLGLVDSDVGGSGTFANAPSGRTVLFFVGGAADTLN